MNLLLHPRSELAIKSFLTKPSHSLLLAGAPGAGKESLALHIAASLLNLLPEQVQKYPYLYILDSRIDASIEKVREAQKFLSLKVPRKNKIRRCIVIHGLENLGHAAQNAMLKTLEEPPVDTIIICTISHQQLVLPTILSRLQTIEILPVPYDQARTKFSNFPKEQFDRAYYISEGYIGLLLALLEKNDEHPLFISISDAKILLQTTGYDRLVKVESIIKNKDKSVAGLLDALYKVLHAALNATINRNNPSNSEIKKLNSQIATVLKAKNLLSGNANQKLVLTWLFYSL